MEGVEVVRDIQERFVKPICVVAFAGDSQQRFQWGNLLRRLDVSHVLLRDSETKWYQRGVRGAGWQSDVVRMISDYRGWYYVKTVGVSSGAYAALLYGQLAEVHEVIAVSPVTGKEVDDLDPRWHDRVLPTPGVEDPSPIVDLRKIFRGGAKPHVRAYVSDGEGTEIDAHMSRRIGVEPTLIPGYSHSALARGMRDSGILDRLLTDRAGVTP